MLLLGGLGGRPMLWRGDGEDAFMFFANNLIEGDGGVAGAGVPLLLHLLLLPRCRGGGTFCQGPGGPGELRPLGVDD